MRGLTLIASLRCVSVREVYYIYVCTEWPSTPTYLDRLTEVVGLHVHREGLLRVAAVQIHPGAR